mmetsp:Transcript_5474/g.9899  ORF Transcript_5474/g.9899 Transcript_5474/m.9899 type:complete len:357 (-) Transcript_5474:254-1324(-)
MLLAVRFIQDGRRSRGRGHGVSPLLAGEVLDAVIQHAVLLNGLAEGVHLSVIARLLTLVLALLDGSPAHVRKVKFQHVLFIDEVAQLVVVDGVLFRLLPDEEVRLHHTLALDWHRLSLLKEVLGLDKLLEGGVGDLAHARKAPALHPTGGVNGVPEELEPLAGRSNDARGDLPRVEANFDGKVVEELLLELMVLGVVLEQVALEHLLYVRNALDHLQRHARSVLCVLDGPLRAAARHHIHLSHGLNLVDANLVHIRNVVEVAVCRVQDADKVNGVEGVRQHGKVVDHAEEDSHVVVALHVGESTIEVRRHLAGTGDVELLGDLLRQHAVQKHLVCPVALVDNGQLRLSNLDGEEVL